METEGEKKKKKKKKIARMNWNQPRHRCPHITNKNFFVLFVVLDGHNAFLHKEQWVHFGDNEHADGYKYDQMSYSKFFTNLRS